ncbi:helix-turn-helix domain-containing protein [Lentzea chajnantorensis]
MTAMTSTAYSRDLGDELRRLREKYTTMTGRALATQLGWDPSKVSNVENGKARASEIDLVQFLTACGQSLDFIETFRRRYTNAFNTYYAQIPDNLRTLAMTESMATKITSFEVLKAPGLLQTREYARQLLLDTAYHEPAEVEKFVDLRIERQTILRRPFRPECLFYVHELALQLILGDAKLMEDQYLRLLFNTHIMRIVPDRYRAVALQGKTTLYEFDKADPITYSESDLVQVFAQDRAAVARTRQLFDHLDAIALDEEQSKSMLTEYISALRKDSDDPGPDVA